VPHPSVENLLLASGAEPTLILERLQPFSSLVGKSWVGVIVFVWLEEWDKKWMTIFTLLVGPICHSV
jgi:hypothetical protein